MSFKVNRLIGAIWILSFLSAIPSLFVTNFVHHTHPDGTIHSLCTKMPNTDYFGSVATLETLRAGIFHVAIPAYMIYGQDNSITKIDLASNTYVGFPICFIQISVGSGKHMLLILT